MHEVVGERLFAVGFCFGGNMVWRLATSNEPRLTAAAPYYGPFPDGATFTDADHAFFNETGARFNPIAATEAWRRTLNWFDTFNRHDD